MAEFKYRAFISYSWADARWANWLHRWLETYRPPAALVGKPGTHGPIAARLHPLFKDREEEAAGASIGAAVEKALASSEFLIVVCSPNSAQSRWVEHEIAWFKTHRNPDKILALIVDGEPAHGEMECFPRALNHQVSADLVVTEHPVDPPLAADARVTGDGKRRAALKVAAAMLGVGLDELVNREERRRTVRTRIIVGASLALALVMSGLTLAAVRARDEADRQRSEADGLIEFMLTDLRDKLEPVGRLDALDAVGERALDYYSRQKLASLDADSLGRRSRALHLVGEVRNIRGDSEAGLVAFREAAQATAELLARDPDNPQRIFDHAQSVFWVGYIAYERGLLEEAEAEFRQYKRLADRLVALDPDKPEWRLESSYAETNLGVMYDAQRRYVEAEKAFAKALQQIDAVAAGEGFNADRQIEVGTMVNWLGKAKKEVGQYAQAKALHEREISIYENLLARDPANAGAKNRLTVALQFLGDARLIAGDTAGSLAALGKSLSLSGEMRRHEPANTEWQQTEGAGRYMQAQTLTLNGQFTAARDMLDSGDAVRKRLVARDPSNVTWNTDFRIRSALSRLQLALDKQDIAAAEQTVRDTRAWLPKADDFDTRPSLARFERAVGDLRALQKRHREAVEHWRKAQALGTTSAAADVEGYFLARRLGESEKAARLADLLDRRGYRHPAYLRERAAVIP